MDRSKPGPGDSPAKEQTLRIARFAPHTGILEAPLTAPRAEAGVETVRAIQRELRARGYGPLPGDGVMKQRRLRPGHHELRLKGKVVARDGKQVGGKQPAAAKTAIG